MKKVMLVIAALMLSVCMISALCFEAYSSGPEKAYVGNDNTPTENLIKHMLSVSPYNLVGDSAQYPDFYGGSYRNSNGETVLLIKESSENDYNELVSILRSVPPLTQTVKHSYNYLVETYKTIRAAMERPEGADIAYAYVDVMNNCVEVAIIDLNESRKTLFEEQICGTDAVSFVNADGYVNLDY